MGFRDSIKNDYLAVDDDPEVVTLVSVFKNPLSNQTYNNVTAFRDELTAAEISPTGGAYTRTDEAWIIPVEAAPVEPKPADQLTRPDGVVLKVLDVGRDPFQLQYRLLCRNVKVHDNLQDTITHLRPANKPDGAAGRTTTLTALVAGVGARVQERSRERDVVHGRQAVKIRYSIWVETQLDARALDVLRDQNSVIYQITGAMDPDRIDVLQEIQAERIV